MIAICLLNVRYLKPKVLGPLTFFWFKTKGPPMNCHNILYDNSWKENLGKCINNIETKDMHIKNILMYLIFMYKHKDGRYVTSLLLWVPLCQLYLKPKNNLWLMCHNINHLFTKTQQLENIEFSKVSQPVHHKMETLLLPKYLHLMTMHYDVIFVFNNCDVEVQKINSTWFQENKYSYNVSKGTYYKGHKYHKTHWLIVKIVVLDWLRNHMHQRGQKLDKYLIFVLLKSLANDPCSCLVVWAQLFCENSTLTIQEGKNQSLNQKINQILI